MRTIFQTEDGRWLTVPDGDPATPEEIAQHLQQQIEREAAFREALKGLADQHSGGHED